MLATMATPKTTKPAPRAPRSTGRASTPASEGRKRSKLSAAGEEASRLARRTLLLTTCETLGWNLTRVATALEMATASDVIRALKELAPTEYAAAQTRGDVATRRDASA